MAITNGYNDTVVLAALRRIGWKNPTTGGYDIVDTANQMSASGRYYNDNSFHTSLTVENIYDAQEDEELDDTGFNDYLRNSMRDPVILSMLNQVFDAPQFIKSGLVYEKYENSAIQLIGNASKFVGVRFKLSDIGEYSIKLNNAILYFNAAATFKVYLYNEFLGKVKDWTVTVEANKQKTLSLDYDIQHISSTNKGGIWFLGYFQNDVDGAQAIDYSPIAQSFCSFNAQSVECDVTGSEQINMVDYSSNYNTYGFNVEVSEYKDLTNKIVQNAHLFDELQGLMMAAKVIELVTNSTRSNIKTRIGRENMNFLLTQLKGIRNEAGYVAGIDDKIKKSVKQVKEAFNYKPKAQIIGC